MAFFQRVLNYLANEIIVRQLAQNRAFQNFALRTAEFFTGQGARAIDKAAAASQVAAKPKPPVAPSGPSFTGSLWKEIQKDLGIGKK
mmetsp:Transcript_15070/g.44625  ORF Transcript_15070/g.44625 Transcript_15070/m.44625 type:complete len:87 (+) Transcript_15070:270-530(+)